MLMEKSPHDRPEGRRERPRLDVDLLPFEHSTERQAWLRCVESETTVDLLERWIRGFQQFHPEIRIDTFIGGSIAGGPALAQGWADMALIARELLPAEMAQRDGSGSRLLRFEVAGGSHRTLGFTDTTVVLVHPDCPLNSLTVPQLAAIFGANPPAGLPPIRTWGDLGVEGKAASRPLQLWAPKPENGFGHFIRERVLDNDEFRSGISVRDRVNPIPEAVSNNPDAIGIAGLGHVGSGVKVLAVAPTADDEPVEPTLQNVTDRRYPLARSIYLFADPDTNGHVDAGVHTFLRYLLSAEGQQVVWEDGVFLPLPAMVVAENLGRLPDPRP